MSDQTDSLLAELLDVQRRILATQEASVANQREMLERQRRFARLGGPLVGLFLLAAFGPYLWNLLAFLTHH